jgi:tetratricopeptide (TPR) repeat protein
MTVQPPGSDGERTEPASPLGDWRDELASGRFDAAHRAFTLTRDGAPEVGRALAGLAEVESLVRDKAWGRAVKRFDRIEDRPAIVPWEQLQEDLACLQRSGEALDRRRPDDALEELQHLKSGLFTAEAETQQGTALIYDDRLEEAASCFQRALDVDPRHFRALTNLGNVALEEGRIDDAITAYERALKLNDSFANAHHNLAVAYRRKGELGRSVRSLRRAQRLMQQRDAADARDRLGSMAGGRSVRMLRWLLYAAVAITLYVVLHSRGVL